jgi:hypothetical protein
LSPRAQPEDTEWVMRRVRGENATKVYRCPGCDHEIPMGQAHVVAWRADTLAGPELRRHWHSACWQGRHREPSRRRGHSPRY